MQKLTMPYATLEVALRVAAQFERMAVLQSPSGDYAVTTLDNVKALKKRGYVDVREAKTSE